MTTPNRAAPQRACHYCKRTDDLRPYGPGGAFVCFPCATATPEREAEATAQFDALLAIAGPMAVLTEKGPMPWIEETEEPQ